jgi:hypothetical protein
MTDADARVNARVNARANARLELRALVASAHSLAHLAENSVCQVWDDGEITSQKGGELLWNRTLHSIYPALGFVTDVEFPCAHDSGHRYAVVTHDEALRVRSLMCRAAGRADPCRVDEEIADHAKAEQAGLKDDPRSVVERIAAANLRKWEGAHGDQS